MAYNFRAKGEQKTLMICYSLYGKNSQHQKKEAILWKRDQSQYEAKRNPILNY